MWGLMITNGNSFHLYLAPIINTGTVPLDAIILERTGLWKTLNCNYWSEYMMPVTNNWVQDLKYWPFLNQSYSEIEAILSINLVKNYLYLDT